MNRVDDIILPYDFIYLTISLVVYLKHEELAYCSNILLVELNKQLNPSQKKIYDTIRHSILSGCSFTDMAKHFFVTRVRS
jgi:hypothetical protein